MRIFFISLWILLLQGLPLQAQFGLDRYQAEKAARTGHYEEALTRYKQLLDDNVNDPELNYNAGNMLYRLGQYEPALKYYERAYTYTRQMKIKTDILYNMANCYYHLRQIEKSAEIYKEVLRKNPYDNDARYNYELILKRQKKTSALQKEKNPNRDQRKENTTSQKKQSRESDGQTQKTKRADKTGAFSRKEAERLLDLLRNKELDYQQKNMKERIIQDRKTEKDW